MRLNAIRCGVVEGDLVTKPCGVYLTFFLAAITPKTQQQPIMAPQVRNKIIANADPTVIAAIASGGSGSSSEKSGGAVVPNAEPSSPEESGSSSSATLMIILFINYR